MNRTSYACFILIADPVSILQYFTSTSGVQWSGDYQRLGGAVELADYCPYLQVIIIFNCSNLQVEIILLFKWYITISEVKIITVPIYTGKYHID